MISILLWPAGAGRETSVLFTNVSSYWGSGKQVWNTAEPISSSCGVTFTDSTEVSWTKYDWGRRKGREKEREGEKGKEGREG